MKRLIIVSTHREIHPFLSKNGIPSSDENCIYNFNFGTQLCITGVGVPSTFIQLGNLIKKGTPEQIVQLGFAGSFKTEYSVGDLLEVNRDCFADLGIDDNGVFIPIAQAMSGTSGAYGWLSYTANSKLPSVAGVTVNTGSGSSERIASIRRIWEPDVETMEGAAAMLFSEKNNISFTQIRAISNFVEPRNTKLWDMDKAAVILSDWLSDYLNREI